MQLQWYCGMNSDIGDFFTEPSECAASGVVTLTDYEKQDWEDGLTPCVVCHACNQMLEDPSHYSTTESHLPGAFSAININPPLPRWEPPLSDESFGIGDYVLFEGGVWEVISARFDPFDEREQKLSIKWVGGPRASKLVFATGISNSDLKGLSEMEVLAYASQTE